GRVGEVGGARVGGGCRPGGVVAGLVGQRGRGGGDDLWVDPAGVGPEAVGVDVAVTEVVRAGPAAVAVAGVSVGDAGQVLLPQHPADLVGFSRYGELPRQGGGQEQVEMVAADDPGAHRWSFLVC